MKPRLPTQGEILALTKKDLDNILYWNRVFSRNIHPKDTDKITKKKIELVFEADAAPVGCPNCVDP